MSTPRVALIGAGGHGVWHRRVLHRLAGEGRLEIAGLCARRPLEPAPDAPIDGIPYFADYTEMLAAAKPDVVIICTPPHTHLPMSIDVMKAGADLLLEKPPVVSLAEHRAYLSALRTYGRVCQVGFQALGSAALTRMNEAVAGGALGPVDHLGAAGAWWRPDTYFGRAAWAGRRTVNGQPVVDGALVNPFGHALMQSLAIAEVASDGPLTPMRVELERYRTRPIEVDDMTFLRLTTTGGLRITVAVTLASATFVAGEITVASRRRSAVLEYPTDRLRLPGEEEFTHVPGRAGLLENLLDHRDDPRAVPLIAPLSRTAVFTMLVETIVTAPEPAQVPARYLTAHPEGGGQVIDGIDRLVRRVVKRQQLPSELSVPWATPIHRVILDRGGDMPGS